jgi:alpha-glucoside transport system permease protein
MTATGAVPVPERSQRPRTRRVGLFQPGNLARVVLGGGILALLVYYVGFSEIALTVVKVVVAVAITMGVIVGLNLLFNMVYDRWTAFLATIGFVLGALTFLVMDGNRLLRELDPRPWAWTLIGGAVGAVALGALGALREPRVRPWVGLAGLGGFGVLITAALDDSQYPGLDWGKLLVCTAIGAAAGLALSGLRRRAEPPALVASALVGAAIGWLIGGWGGADLGAGSLGEALIATVVPLAAIGVRIGLSDIPNTTARRQIEGRSRAWIFVTPTLLLVAAGLIVPLIRTIILSFKDRNAEENVGWQNYGDVIFSRRPAVTDEFINTDNWTNLFGSRLWWVGIAVVGAGILVGVIAGRMRRQAFAAEPSNVVPMLVGFFLAACAVFATVRGTLINNLWWILVVTALATAMGLIIAVLADRARGENIAKSLIFLPMAISFIGAGIIWRFMYVTRNPSRPQTGLLNAIWVGLGELSNSPWRWVVAAVLLAIVGGLLWLAWRSINEGNGTRAGFSIGFAVFFGLLTYLLLVPGLGGFVVTEDGEVEPTIIDFIREQPYNNMWLMVVLIWLQVGFAMVIFSSAIKAVPTELTEAARIDGANESQVFWKVTLPQIAPTVGVVTTTILVLVLKVFDIVRVMTGGLYGTQVIANQMANAVTDRNSGIAAALATLLFIGVLPVMFYNLRRMRNVA